MARWFEAMRAVLGGTAGRSRSSSATPSWRSSASRRPRGRRTAGRAGRGRDAGGARAAERGAPSGARPPLAMRIGVNTGEVVAGDARAGAAGARGRGQRRGAARAGRRARRDPRQPGDPRLVARCPRRGRAARPSTSRVRRAGRVRRLVAVDQARRASIDASSSDGRPRTASSDLRVAFERASSSERCLLVTVLGPAGVGRGARPRVPPTGRGRRDGAPRPVPALRQGITWYPVAELLRSAVGLDEEAETSLGHGAACANASKATRMPTRVLARLAEPLGVASEPAPVEELFWAIRRVPRAACHRRAHGRRPRRPALGRARHPRSRGASGGVGPRRPARPAGDGASRAPRPPRRLGRWQAGCDDIPP